jgi:hypothetical protein
MSSGAALHIQQRRRSIDREHPRVDELEFGIMLSTPGIFLHKPLVRKRLLRVFVEHFQVGMSGVCVKIVVNLFDVFAMIGLAVGQSKQALLQDRILPIPKRPGQTLALLVVANAGNAVLASPIGAASSVIVGPIFPRRAAGRVIFPDASPALTDVWPPEPPTRSTIFRFRQSDRLCSHRAAPFWKWSGTMYRLPKGET